jgi:hypothetical protein
VRKSEPELQKALEMVWQLKGKFNYFWGNCIYLCTCAFDCVCVTTSARYFMVLSFMHASRFLGGKRGWSDN